MDTMAFLRWQHFLPKIVMVVAPLVNENNIYIDKEM